MRVVLAAAMAAALCGCALSSTTQLSQDTVRVEASTAPICGSTSVQKIALRQAAAETIRRGYDRFIIVDDKAAVQRIYTNIPGFAPPSHSNEVVVKMFRESDRAAGNTISARETLGPDWKELSSKTTMTCLN